MPCGQCHVANARGQCPWAPLLQVLFALVLPAARSAKLSIIAHADDATNVGSITMSPQDISISAGDRGSTRAAGTRPQLWTQPATEKVLLTSPVPTSAQGPSVVPSISLAAQKGECERAFLVIAGVQGQELHNLSLTFPTVPCAGTEWRYYQQGYMWTNATRNLLWMPQQVNTSGGWYPEPLLPILPGDQIDRVPVGLSQALLVEACVPSMAQAGNYSFEATVAGCYANCSSSGGCDRSCGASFALQLQMNLEVWPIKLVTHQGIQMNLREANLAAALPDSYVPGCYPLTEPRCATNAAWFAFLTKHRMPPSPFPSGDALAGDAPARLRTLLAFAEAGTQLILLGDVSGCPNSNWLGTRCNFTQEVIEQKIDALRPLVGNLSTAGYGDRLAVYGFDEVMTGSPTIHADLYNVFGAVKKAFPRVKTMSAGFGWRSTGAVPPLDAPLDIYVALYYDYCWPDVNTGQAFRGWPNCSIWMSTVRAWRSAGKEFWLYWANEPGSGPGANAHSKGGIWLNTFVQWPTIAARLLFWLGPAAVEGGIDGWYYWAINNWAPGFARPIHRVNGTLYTNASNVQSNSIGDGVLFYIAEDGSPAPGLRFVNIADGIEDVSLFRQCGADCVDLARRLVRSGDQWVNNPRLLESTRREAARRIIKATRLRHSAAQQPQREKTPAVAAQLMATRVMANTDATGCAWHGSHDPRCLFARWVYGNSIILDSLLYASTFLPGVNASGFVDERLNSWLSDGNSSAFNISHNIIRPPVRFGQVPDIYPFVYLTQAEYHRQHNTRGFSNATALLIGRVGALDIIGWPKLWTDGLLSRDDEHASAESCWGGGPVQQNGGAKAACVWADDATMTLTPVSRELAASTAAMHSPVRAAWQAWLSKQHSLYAKHLQDVDGLFYHGQDASVRQHSCCKWSRANGWMMTAHVEVLSALAKESTITGHHHGNDFDAVLAIYQRHAAAIAKVQSDDGRFYNLLNDTSTWLETSGTAMFAHSIAVGVLNGWLNRDEYEQVLRKAWRGLQKMITPTGEVDGIVGGCGVQSSPSAYNHSDAFSPGGGYAGSSPGLGSVIRAAVSLARYEDQFGPL